MWKQLSVTSHPRGYKSPPPSLAITLPPWDVQASEKFIIMCRARCTGWPERIGWDEVPPGWHERLSVQVPTVQGYCDWEEGQAVLFYKIAAATQSSTTTTPIIQQPPRQQPPPAILLWHIESSDDELWASAKNVFSCFN